MTLNPAAELALDRQRVFHEWTAQRQQPRSQDQLPPVAEPPHSMSPLRQDRILRVQRLQFVDVPQQSLPRARYRVGPASLLQAAVVVVGGVEVTHQNPAGGLAQDLVHHLPAPAPAQEEPLRRRAEKPAPGPDRGSRRSRFSHSPANPFHRRGPPGWNGYAPATRSLPAVVKMVITGNNHSPTRSLAGGRAAPTVQGGSARESRPGTPNGSAFKPPRRNSHPGQPGPDGDHPAGAALQAPVSTAPGPRPSTSIRASRASSRVR